MADEDARYQRPAADVLIETKLHAPPVRSDWVERPALARDLDSRGIKLVLVDAPAGYGKTTLLAQWSSDARASRPFAWISLDPGDDDPVRLWRHVVSALHRACPALDVGEILQLLHRQMPDIYAALAILINELAALAAPVVIILDDYHVIKEPRCHEQLEFLLLRLPSTAKIVLSTRADPPLPLARLRAAGELAEVRVKELHFTPQQAEALIQRVASVRLGQQNLSELVERTEGWPAGVYLAALSLRGHPDPENFIRGFTGGNRYIVDYLGEEIIGRQPEDVRQFLLRTAVLERFTARLCDAVAEIADSEHIIRKLEDENLFLIPLDPNREWYRYHHLFAQFLLGELARAGPGPVSALHKRASAWYLESGLIDEAVGHGLAAGDVAGSIALMAEHWHTYVLAGRMATVRGWLRSLGDEELAASPLAAHCAAWASALAGDLGPARRLLPVIAAGGDTGPLPDGMRSLRSSAALLEATYGFTGLEPMCRAGAEAVELENDPESTWYALARVSYGGALYLSGEFGTATRQLEEALSSSPSFPVVRLFCLAMMSMVAVEEGRLDEAEQLARGARDLVIDDTLGLGETPQASQAYSATGRVLAARGRLQEARDAYEHALEARRTWSSNSVWPTVEIMLRLATVLLELGDKPGAAALLSEAREVLASFPHGTGTQMDRLERLERRLARPPTDPSSSGEALTEREQAVLQLLQGTLSTREIGQALSVSQNTIKTHIRAIYRKLNVSARHDAVTRGIELGVLPDHADPSVNLRPPDAEQRDADKLSGDGRLHRGPGLQLPVDAELVVVEPDEAEHVW
jgi:LuxR family transcriptional regulator, maltose regulon positive regulatory protein